LDIRLEKAEKGHWDKIETDLPKAERMKQREESISRYDEWKIEQDKIREKTKLRLDKLAIEK
jgi:predicted alpha/beta hydrolase family esterase